LIEMPERCDEQALDIIGEATAPEHSGKEFKRRTGHDFRRQGNEIEVVSEVRDRATAAGATEHAGVTLAIVADPAQVMTACIGEEDVGARVQLLVWETHT
jgi:hypothetical protein